LKRRIGIMGGTFDPPHMAHLLIAENSRAAFSLDEVLFIPAADPPHKQDRAVTLYAHRYYMTELSIAANDAFTLSDIERKRSGLSYSLVTVRELQKLYRAGADFYFITGMDSINDLHKWYHPKELLASCHFIGATRLGDPVNTIALEKDFGKLAYERIHFLEVPGMEISSTDIRRRVREGLPIRYLVPDAVKEYIRKEGLYLDKGDKRNAFSG